MRRPRDQFALQLRICGRLVSPVTKTSLIRWMGCTVAMLDGVGQRKADEGGETSCARGTKRRGVRGGSRRKVGPSNLPEVRTSREVVIADPVQVVKSNIHAARVAKRQSYLEDRRKAFFKRRIEVVARLDLVTKRLYDGYKRRNRLTRRQMLANPPEDLVKLRSMRTSAWDRLRSSYYARARSIGQPDVMSKVVLSLAIAEAKGEFDREIERIRRVEGEASDDSDVPVVLASDPFTLAPVPAIRGVVRTPLPRNRGKRGRVKEVFQCEKCRTISTVYLDPGETRECKRCADRAPLAERLKARKAGLCKAKAPLRSTTQSHPTERKR